METLAFYVFYIAIIMYALSVGKLAKDTFIVYGPAAVPAIFFLAVNLFIFLITIGHT